MLFEFAKFENELFAFPLIFLGIYFLFLKKWYFFVPFLCSLPFWMWIGYFQPMFADGLLELQLFAGLSTLFVSVFFILPYFLQRKKWNLVLGVVFFVVGLWSSHLTVFLVPLVVLGIGYTVGNLVPIKWDTKNIILPCVILIVCLNVALFLASPTQNDWNFVDGAITLANDENLPIYNDWSYGHWLRIRGYETFHRSGGENPDYNNLENFVALTTRELGHRGCERNMDFSSWSRSMKVWKCN